MEFKNKREQVIYLINQGGATKESLCEACKFNDKSLASVFAQLRLMGKFNMKNEDGTYSLVDEATWEAARATPTKAPKTPKEAYDAAVKREGRAATAQANAEKRYNADPSRENELRLTIANAELELSGILMGQAEEALSAAGVEPDGPECDIDGVEPDGTDGDFAL